MTGWQNFCGFLIFASPRLCGSSDLTQRRKVESDMPAFFTYAGITDSDYRKH